MNNYLEEMKAHAIKVRANLETWPEADLQKEHNSTLPKNELIEQLIVSVWDDMNYQ